MERHQFKITINAPRERVWDILWNDNTYPQWTAAFCEGSRAESDWQKGSKILFLDGNNNGMVSTIIENTPNEFMSFKHMGEVKNGAEDTQSEKVMQWAGAYGELYPDHARWRNRAASRYGPGGRV